MNGQTISHYKILDKLGEGGMGVVYKAQDTRLNRVVALKFLPQHLTATEEERARFLQEAQAAAILNHANICTIHAIEEIDGQQFIVMEYIDGRTLRDLRPHTLKIETILTYAIQIGEALQEAHSKGIVHRDIKSDNVMVNARGQVKVMDFGLAKLKGSLKLTRTSSTVGTLGYMAPEQIQGGEVDARSDIFSFGALLFEMFTGRLPFRGEHEAAMMYSILNEEPESIERHRSDVPPALVNLIQRTLEKDPADRYQHADDLVSELRRIQKQTTRVMRPIQTTSVSGIPIARPSQTAPPTVQPVIEPPRLNRRLVIPIAIGIVVVVIAAIVVMMIGRSSTSSTVLAKKMLVVLPFENLGSPEQEYFADGITEEITSRLSGLSGLGVIARTSAMQYKKTSKTLKEIAGELNVDHVLQGTIRWSKSVDGQPTVRVSPALIKIADGTQVWSQPYDAVVSDIFAMQSEIASKVAQSLGVSLLQPEVSALEARPTENAEAYDAYLRGNDYFRRSYREQDFQIAVQMFEKATTLDPKFALAYAKLSETHSATYWFFFDHTNDRLLRAKSAVDEALRLDPSLPDAHQSLGYYYYWGFLDYDNALKEFTIAQKSRPNDSRLLLGIGSVYRRRGDMQLAAASMVRAAEVDPRSTEVARNTAQTFWLLRNFPESEQYYQRAISLSPDVAAQYWERATMLVCWKGSTQQARDVLKEALTTAGFDKDEGIQIARINIEIMDRKYPEALAIVASTEFSNRGDQFRLMTKNQMLARVYRLMGQHDLERSYADSARVFIEEKIRQEPNDARFHAALGVVYAQLGRKQDAIRSGARAVELLPVSKEAWRGAHQLYYLAQVYTIVGETAKATNILRQLLTQPSEFSPALVRIDPTWDPLRNTPEFKKMLEDFL
jgi:TolB-like protein/tetratricopeptide (TPR) repeat protein/predicted Ser/Thr protein kinase